MRILISNAGLSIISLSSIEGNEGPVHEKWGGGGHIHVETFVVYCIKQ